MKAAYREDNQHNHERTLRDRARFRLFVLGEEKQGAQAKMLDIKPDEYVVHCFREEKTAGFAVVRLIIDPSEKVFVKEVEQKEGRKCKAIDDRRYDGIAERDYNHLSHCGEESTPRRCVRRILDLVHRAWRRSKESHFDIIHHQRPNLKEAASRSGKTLK